MIQKLRFLQKTVLLALSRNLPAPGNISSKVCDIPLRTTNKYRLSLVLYGDRKAVLAPTLAQKLLNTVRKRTPQCTLCHSQVIVRTNRRRGHSCRFIIPARRERIGTLQPTRKVE